MKNLLALTVVAVVLAGLATWSSKRAAPTPGAQRLGDKVIPGLADKLNDVASITVQSPAATALVSRVDGLWRVPGRFGYPADFGKVSDALRRLADLKIAQVLRIAPPHLAELHLLPASATNTEERATVVDLQSADRASLAVLRIGKDHSRPAPPDAPPGMGGYPDGKYVATDDAHVYLVTDMLSELAASDRDWMDPEFINVGSADIATIEITGGPGGAIRLERPAAGGELTVKDLPAGKEVDATKLSRLTGALSYLRFEDLADPALAPAVTGLDRPVTYKAVTTQGTTYTLHVGGTPTNDTRRYTTVSVSFEAPAEPAVSATDTNMAAAAAAKAEERRKREGDAKALNAKLSPWVYLLGDYQASALLTPANELLKDKPPATNAAPATVTAPAAEAN